MARTTEESLDEVRNEMAELEQMLELVQHTVPVDMEMYKLLLKGLTPLRHKEERLFRRQAAAAEVRRRTSSSSDDSLPPTTESASFFMSWSDFKKASVEEKGKAFNLFSAWRPGQTEQDQKTAKRRLFVGLFLVLLAIIGQVALLWFEEDLLRALDTRFAYTSGWTPINPPMPPPAPSSPAGSSISLAPGRLSRLRHLIIFSVKFGPLIVWLLLWAWNVGCITCAGLWKVVQAAPLAVLLLALSIIGVPLFTIENYKKPNSTAPHPWWTIYVWYVSVVICVSSREVIHKVQALGLVASVTLLFVTVERLLRHFMDLSDKFSIVVLSPQFLQQTACHGIRTVFILYACVVASVFTPAALFTTGPGTPPDQTVDAAASNIPLLSGTVPGGEVVDMELGKMNEGSSRRPPRDSASETLLPSSSVPWYRPYLSWSRPSGSTTPGVNR